MQNVEIKNIAAISTCSRFVRFNILNLFALSFIDYLGQWSSHVPIMFLLAVCLLSSFLLRGTNE